MVGIDDTAVAATLENNTADGGGFDSPEQYYQNITSLGDKDTRIRIRAMRGQENNIYGEVQDDNLLSILSPYNGSGTDGLMFPYTPQVSVSQAVNYNEIGLTHTNGELWAYRSTPNVSIDISAKFTVQNQREGQYALAALHFLRTVSKMHFGEAAKLQKRAGLPPPVLIFSGYGNYMFDNLPVILKNHSYALDDNVDTVIVRTAGGVARIPSLFTLNMSLSVEQTPRAMRKTFNLESFRTGALMRSSATTGWI